MINVGRFQVCVCQGNGNPDGLCGGDLLLQEKGKKVSISLRHAEEARALVIDGCICNDDGLKCDGLFLYRRGNHKWILLVELKGSDIQHAFEQLHYTRFCRPEYAEIEQSFTEGRIGNLTREAFIVSNHLFSKIEQNTLENQWRMRVKNILFSEATSPIPDLRDFL